MKIEIELPNEEWAEIFMDWVLNEPTDGFANAIYKKANAGVLTDNNPLVGLTWKKPDRGNWTIKYTND